MEIFVAAAGGHWQTIVAYLRDGGDPNARNEFGATPILISAYFRHTRCVAILANAGADIHAVDAMGNGLEKYELGKESLAGGVTNHDLDILITESVSLTSGSKTKGRL